MVCPEDDCKPAKPHLAIIVRRSGAVSDWNGRIMIKSDVAAARDLHILFRGRGDISGQFQALIDER